MPKKRITAVVREWCRVRPAKNFLAVLGRATRRLGIRDEESLVQRSTGRSLYTRKICLDDATPRH